MRFKQREENCLAFKEVKDEGEKKANLDDKDTAYLGRADVESQRLPK